MKSFQEYINEKDRQLFIIDYKGEETGKAKKLKHENIFSYDVTEDQLKNIKTKLGKIYFSNGRDIIIPMEFRTEAEYLLIGKELGVSTRGLPLAGYLQLRA